MNSTPCVAVVIPSYRVTRHILDVIASIGEGVALIYVVDDRCPDHSADFVAANCSDPRVRLVRLPVNQGVGGAVLAGYEAAIAEGADIIVKVDGDGQMDPSLIPYFVAPIAQGQADYTKGNRFFDLEQIRSMPPMRIMGNAVLSFMAKISTGYWDIFDPTNGYTAIHADVARQLPMTRISRRYFFETDLLFRLNTLRAVVFDVPMHARYGDEVSNLRITQVIGEFFFKHVRNTFKRLFYNYYLRDLSVASLELPLGLLLMLGGAGFGVVSWVEAASKGVPATAGAVMLAALPMFVGLQLLLAFLGFDIASVPRRPIQPHAFSRMALKRHEPQRASVRDDG